MKNKWTEEDEKIKESIKKVLANTDLSKFALDYTFADMINWLEKLKDQQIRYDITADIQAKIKKCTDEICLLQSEMQSKMISSIVNSGMNKY